MASGSSDQILFRCDACGKAFRVPVAMAGQAAKCSGCGKLLSIPGGTPSTVLGQLRGHTTRSVRPVAFHDRTHRLPAGQVRTNDSCNDDEITFLCCQCGEEYVGRSPSGRCPACTAGADASQHRVDAGRQATDGERGPESGEVCPACRHPIPPGAQTCRHCGRDFRAAKRRRLARGPSAGISLQTSLCSRCGEEYDGHHPLGLCPDCRPDDAGSKDGEPRGRSEGGSRKADVTSDPESAEACPACGHPIRPGTQACRHCGHDFRAAKRKRPACAPLKGISLQTSLCSRCGEEYDGHHPLGLCPDCSSDDAGSEDDEPQDRFGTEGPDDESEPEPEAVCPDCDHPNRPDARRCSHCGYHFRAKKRSRSVHRPPDQERSPRRPVSTLSTAALCLGLAGLSSLALPFLAFLSGAGMVLGVMGLKQIGSSEGRLRGKSLAVIGILVSSVSIVLVGVQAVRSPSDTREAGDAAPAPQFSQPALPPSLPPPKKPVDP